MLSYDAVIFFGKPVVSGGRDEVKAPTLPRPMGRAFESAHKEALEQTTFSKVRDRERGRAPPQSLVKDALVCKGARSTHNGVHL